jgi:iron complex outermembrane receptor protein
MKRLNFALLCGCALAAMSNGAHAQEAQAEQTQANEGGIQEIIVTAQKRAENLQDTPISILALNSEALEKQGINSINDMFTGAVPSLRVAPFIGRTSAVSIGMRGLVPADVTQVSRDPTVGIYIDGVYLGRVSGLGMDLADIERIEVLRGPQGTLFGRNTIGGAVSVVSRKPTGELGVDLKAGVGNFSGRTLAGHLNLPKFAGISVKVDGIFDKHDGFVRNPLQGAEDYGAVEKYGVKATALWEASDNFSIQYSYDYSRDNSTGNYYYIFATQQAAAVVPTFITVNPSRRVDVAPVGLPNYENPQTAQGHSITATFEASDSLTIRSLTSWRKLSSVQWEQDNGGLTSWGPNRRFGRMSYAKVNQRQFSEELQFIGNLENFKYVAGFYYFEEHGRDTATTFSAGTLNSTVSGVNLFPTPTADAGAAVPDRASEADVRSVALFGQATWSPMGDEGLHLTVGARWTDDKKSGRLTALRGVDPNLNFRFRSRRVDPSVVVSYDLTRAINAYVKWGRAYRAGGANTRSVALTPFGEEELTSWEIGLKSDLLDRHLRVNIAAYQSTLNDQQVDFTNPAFVSNSETRNAPEKREIKGIEADVTVAPFQGFTAGLNYVYTDAPTAPVTNPFTNLVELTRSAFTPKHALTANLDYEFPQFSFGKVRAHVDFNTAGGYYANNTPSIDNTLSRKTVLTNARLALAEIPVGGSDLELSVWGKNLFDTKFQLFDVTIAGRNTYGMFNEQRTWGVDARVKF